MLYEVITGRHDLAFLGARRAKAGLECAQLVENGTVMPLIERVTLVEAYELAQHVPIVRGRRPVPERGVRAETLDVGRQVSYNFV